MQNSRQRRLRKEEKPFDNNNFWDSLPINARYDAILRAMQGGMGAGLGAFGVFGGFGKSPLNYVREWEA
jgi:hypothetical protein